MSDGFTMTRRKIDYSDIPETDAAFWADAEVVPPSKERITIRIDKDVLAWFRRQPRYQTAINRVLRRFYDHQKGDAAE